MKRLKLPWIRISGYAGLFFFVTGAFFFVFKNYLVKPPPDSGWRWLDVGKDLQVSLSYAPHSISSHGGAFVVRVRNVSYKNPVLELDERYGLLDHESLAEGKENCFILCRIGPTGEKVPLKFYNIRRQTGMMGRIINPNEVVEYSYILQPGDSRLDKISGQAIVAGVLYFYEDNGLVQAKSNGSSLTVFRDAWSNVVKMPDVK